MSGTNGFTDHQAALPADVRPVLETMETLSEGDFEGAGFERALAELTPAELAALKTLLTKIREAQKRGNR